MISKLPQELTDPWCAKLETSLAGHALQAVYLYGSAARLTPPCPPVGFEPA